MSLAEYFNDKTDKHRPKAEKVNNNVLGVRVERQGYMHDTRHVYYDFMSRTVEVLGFGENNNRLVLFSEMDQEVLRLHRELLIELGGNPLPLPVPEEKIIKKNDRGLSV